MKVSNIKKSSATTLQELECGAIFRPVNSKTLFIKLDRNAGDILFADNCDRLWLNSVCDYDGEDFANQTEFEALHEYTQFILCADIVSGEIGFMYEGINITPLKCELLVEE